MQDTKSQAHLSSRQMPTYQRVLSDNELYPKAYYLPSRTDGTNDAYMQVFFRAPPVLLNPLRLAMVWAIIRLRHPLLASRVQMAPGQYDDARFKYTPPSSALDAILDAKNYLDIRNDIAAEKIVDQFLNGPRKLSNDVLSHLTIVERPSIGSDPRFKEYDFIFYVTHCVADGLACHQIANLFFVILGNQVEGHPVRTDAQLARLVESQWDARWSAREMAGWDCALPVATEDRLRAAYPDLEDESQESRVEDFNNHQAQYVGGHSIPREQNNFSRRRNVFSNITYTQPQTTRILSICKSHNVTISNALFVLCNFAWIRTMGAHPSLFSPPSELPMMMYSALSLRPHIPASPGSFVFLSVGYFNVMLPATLSSSEEATFWSRAKEVKMQLEKYLGSPKLISRSLEMSRQRAVKAKRFAKEDDEAQVVKDTPYYIPRAKKSVEETEKELLAARKDTPYYVPRAKKSAEETAKEILAARKDTPYYVPWAKPSVTGDNKNLASAVKDTPYYVPREMKSEKQLEEEILAAKKDTPYYVDREPPSHTNLPPKPSVVLLGLSQVNNVDRLYTDDLYPSINLVSITAGTRKAKGGILMFSRTFKGRLHLSLGWDMNGFKEGLVEEFWERVKGGMDEFLVHGGERAAIPRL